MIRVSSCSPSIARPSANRPPALGASSPATSRSSVLLPQPLRPTMAMNCPGSIASCVLRSTSRSP